MSFHRLTTPSYYMSGGWPPAGYDYINLTPGNPNQAPADGAKSGGHPSDGSYFIVFGEDATSTHANRGHKALAQNCDQLDEWLNSSVAAPAEVTGTAAGGETYIDITGDVFVGKFGTPNTQDERNQLAILLNSTTGALLETAAGVPIRVSIIGTSGGASRVGLEATGFYTNARITFSAALTLGMTYRLVYLKRSKLSNISSTDIDGLVRNLLRSGDLITFSGAGAWADTTANPASGVDFRLQKIITDLTAVTGKYGAGKLSKGVSPAWADTTTIAATNLSDWVNSIVVELSRTTPGTSGAGKVGSAAFTAPWSGAPWTLNAEALINQIEDLLTDINHPYRMYRPAGDYAMDSSQTDHTIMVQASASPRIITLPTASSSWQGRRVKLIDELGASEAYPITIRPVGTQKINGLNADYIVASDYGQWELTSWGLNWFLK